MTTTVRILIEGNKACEVRRVENDLVSEMRTIKPNQFEVMIIHGNQKVEVQETGDFL